MKLTYLHWSMFITGALHQLQIKHHENIHQCPLSVHFEYFNIHWSPRSWHQAARENCFKRHSPEGKFCNPKISRGKTDNQLWSKSNETTSISQGTILWGERDEKLLNVLMLQKQSRDRHIFHLQWKSTLNPFHVQKILKNSLHPIPQVLAAL